MKKLLILALASSILLLPALAQAHNLIIFVADGLRYGSVEPGNMPNMARLKSEGVDFANSHSLYPTVTTVNASAIATGHGIGDTGDFGNTLYVGKPMISLKGSTLGLPLRPPGDTGAPVDFSNGGKLPGGSGMLGDPAHPDM